MNYEILLLLFVIYIIPMILIFRNFVKENKRIDEEYNRRLREIEKKYGVKL